MYKVNEIFYSLQGEGYWTGTPMVFVRFSGCNLVCPFCDTDHRNYLEMSKEEILSEVLSLSGTCRRVCLTGGEPSLQADGSLVEGLHRAGFAVHVETNGTRPLPEGVDWVTLSPKSAVVLERADEVKVVFPDPGTERWAAFPAAWHFLQPCDGPELEQNTAEALAYIKSHPFWRLSLQTHKYLGIR